MAFSFNYCKENGLLKVRGSHVHYRSGNILKIVQYRNASKPSNPQYEVIWPIEEHPHLMIWRAFQDYFFQTWFIVQ